MHSQETSSSIRCCASMSSASGTETPKKAASKVSTEGSQPPKRARSTDLPCLGASKSHLPHKISSPHNLHQESLQIIDL